MCAIVDNLILIHFIDVLYVRCPAHDSLDMRFSHESGQFQVSYTDGLNNNIAENHRSCCKKCKIVIVHAIVEAGSRHYIMVHSPSFLWCREACMGV